MKLHRRTNPCVSRFSVSGQWVATLVAALRTPATTLPSLARGETLSRLQTRGLEVTSALGDFVIAHPKAVADPNEAGPVDVVLLAVKAQHVREAGGSLSSLIGPETVVIPLQNGIEAHGQLAEILGPEHVLGGLCKIFSTRLAPARIRHVGFPPVLIFGGVRTS